MSTRKRVLQDATAVVAYTPHSFCWHPSFPAPFYVLAGMKASVHCLRVSSGDVTVWPTVRSDVKISKSLPPCTHQEERSQAYVQVPGDPSTTSCAHSTMIQEVL